MPASVLADLQPLPFQPLPLLPCLSLQDLELMLRIVLGFILGAVIGYEREVTHRPAGLRTHMLVAAGAAAFTVASTYGFVGQGTVRDPARVAAQIVAGVGFLGAGTIWRTSNTVLGLTTAASIWLVAAVGLLAGSGLYLLAVFTTLCGYATLRWGRPPARRRRHKLGEPSITPENDVDEDEHDEHDEQDEHIVD